MSSIVGCSGGTVTEWQSLSYVSKSGDRGILVKCGVVGRVLLYEHGRFSSIFIKGIYNNFLQFLFIFNAFNVILP